MYGCRFSIISCVIHVYPLFLFPFLPRLFVTLHPLVLCVLYVLNCASLGALDHLSSASFFCLVPPAVSLLQYHGSTCGYAEMD